MKPRTILAIILIPMGLIIAAVPQNKTRQFRLTAAELLAEVNTGSHYIAPESVADQIIQKDPSIRLIDVRNHEEFEKYSLPEAINIPLGDLLSEEHSEILNQELKTNIFFSNGTLDANEAWMITRQLGYINNYVLEGGLNYWFEAIMNPQKPSSASSNEEFAKYDFRLAASQSLGGGKIAPATGSQQAAAPAKAPVKPAAKKKKAAGGC